MGNGTDSLNYFDVDCLEVWAVGGNEWIADSLAAQKSAREWKEAMHAKARKVVLDKKQLLSDLQFLAAAAAPTGSSNNHGLFGHVNHTTLDRWDIC